MLDLGESRFGFDSWPFHFYSDISAVFLRNFTKEAEIMRRLMIKTNKMFLPVLRSQTFQIAMKNNSNVVLRKQSGLNEKFLSL